MLNDSKFLALRDMESFTEDMFNRIISFQEKQHPAWDTGADFEQRIRGLPLHYFIFSSPDRDPVQFGPSVAHYYPLTEEIHKLAHYIKYSQATSVVDMYPGNGLVGSLLARELARQLPAATSSPKSRIQKSVLQEPRVHGLAYNNIKPCQIDSFFDQEHYRLHDRQEDFEQYRADCDVIFASWIPSGLNPSSEMLRQQAKLIIYVGTDHINTETGQRQVGDERMLQDLDPQYTLWSQWSTTRPKDVLHEIWPDMTPNIEEVRTTHVFARNDMTPAPPFKFSPESPLFDWELELDMALLAREAKQLLQIRGLPV